MVSGKSDELKGRVKEAAGAPTGDKQLKRGGLPNWGYHNYGYGPSGIGGIILIILLILLLTGRLTSDGSVVAANVKGQFSTSRR